MIAIGRAAQWLALALKPALHSSGRKASHTHVSAIDRLSASGYHDDSDAPPRRSSGDRAACQRRGCHMARHLSKHTVSRSITTARMRVGCATS